MLTCFGMMWNYDKFSRQNTKFGKISALSKNHIFPNLIVKKHIHIGATIMQYIKKFKTFHLKIPLEENMFFGKKDPKKGQ